MRTPMSERPADPVREARAALVEVDDAQVARQAMHETGEDGGCSQ